MTLDDWHRQRAELLGRLQQFYGAMPARGALEVEEYQRREFATHTQIKLSYAGEPGERIPAYLLLPRNAPCANQAGILAAHQCAYACDVGKEQVVGKCVDWPDQAIGESAGNARMKKPKTRKPKKRGPKPEILRIEGMDWKEAIKKSFQKECPPGGWPKEQKG